jgi:hypothetical protein
MSSPASPGLLKGALLSVTLPNPVPRVIPFQYNPDTLRRRLEAQTASGDGAEREATLLRAAPIETISLEAELDATDALADGEQRAEQLGLHPDLAALELLVYPPTAIVLANTALAALGMVEISPAEGPFTLFVWGVKRIVPVRVTDFSVVEQAYDPALNPIRATISLDLRVLSYNDLPVTHPGYHVFLAHQVTKEALAGVARAAASSQIVGSEIRVV